MKPFIDIVFKISDSLEESGGKVTLKNGSTVYLYGSSVPSVWDIQKSLDLNFRIHFADWGEALELVSNGTYDWGAPLMSLSEKLVKNDLNGEYGPVFLHPLASTTSNVYFRQPPPENIYITIFRPFQLQVWISFLVCILIGTVLVHRSHLYRNSVLGKKVGTPPSQNMLQIIEFVRGRYFSNDLEAISMHMTNPSLYLGILVSIYLGAFLLIFYTAKIASIFARNDLVVRSTEDLLKYEYTLSSFNDLHFDRLFKHPNKARRHETRFWGGKIAVGNVAPDNTADPRFAFMTHPEGFYGYAQHEFNFTYGICAVSSLTSIIKTPQSMYIKKDSPLREELNQKIVLLLERGLNHRYQTKYKQQYEYKCPEEPLGFAQIKYNHVLFAFVILIMGAFVAIFIEIGMFVKANAIYFKQFGCQYIFGIIGSVKNIRLQPLTKKKSDVVVVLSSPQDSLSIWGTVQHV